MPNSIVNRFVVLDASDLGESRLRLRFLPDAFDVDHTDPVLRIEVDLTADIDSAPQKIAAIEQGLVDNIEADSSNVVIWVDHLDAPIQFEGAVTWNFEDYITSDYVSEIEALDLIVNKQNVERSQLQGTIDQALRFIDRTIDRIEKKHELTHAADSEHKAQIQLLRGVRRQLTDD
jgi:hypothetical protein